VVTQPLREIHKQRKFQLHIHCTTWCFKMADWWFMWTQNSVHGLVADGPQTWCANCL